VFRFVRRKAGRCFAARVSRRTRPSQVEVTGIQLAMFLQITTRQIITLQIITRQTGAQQAMMARMGMPETGIYR
jgi:hypothetical protein